MRFDGDNLGSIAPTGGTDQDSGPKVIATEEYEGDGRIMG